MWAAEHVRPLTVLSLQHLDDSGNVQRIVGVEVTGGGEFGGGEGGAGREGG